MDLNKIGSLSAYMKNFQLENKWTQKKKTGDLGSESKKTEMQRKNEQFKAQYYNQREQNPEDETLKSINNKIATGTKLTPDEMKYLQSKNPALYQQLKNEELEEKAFEDKLKNCKTKDEVEKLKFEKTSKAMSSVNSVKSNPNIPEGTKAAIAGAEMRKLQKINNIVAKFVKSGEYSKLPTEAEVHKVEKEIAEAKQNQTEEILRTENPSDNKEVETKVSTTENADVEKTLIKNTSDNDNEKTPAPKTEKTLSEAENSREAEKIKRSKAKKAYAEAENNFNVIQPDVSHIFNSKDTIL